MLCFDRKLKSENLNQFWIKNHILYLWRKIWNCILAENMIYVFMEKLFMFISV